MTNAQRQALDTIIAVGGSVLRSGFRFTTADGAVVKLNLTAMKHLRRDNLVTCTPCALGGVIWTVVS